MVGAGGAGGGLEVGGRLAFISSAVPMAEPLLKLGLNGLLASRPPRARDHA